MILTIKLHSKCSKIMFISVEIKCLGNYMEMKYYINNITAQHPHNLYLQILAENGLFGLFLSCYFYLLVFNILKEFFYRNFKKIEKIKDRNLILLLGIFINFWPIVPFGNFYNNWLSIVIYLPIGFLLYFRSKND